MIRRFWKVDLKKSTRTNGSFCTTHRLRFGHYYALNPIPSPIRKRRLQTRWRSTPISTFLKNQIKKDLLLFLVEIAVNFRLLCLLCRYFEALVWAECWISLVNRLLDLLYSAWQRKSSDAQTKRTHALYERKWVKEDPSVGGDLIKLIRYMV